MSTMSDEDFTLVTEQLKALAPLLMNLDASGMVERITRAETIGPFVDPTAFLGDTFDSLADLKTLGEAAQAFQRVIRKQIERTAHRGERVGRRA